MKNKNVSLVYFFVTLYVAVSIAMCSIFRGYVLKGSWL